MPLPRSLTTSAHQDLDLEVVAGAWPDDIDGEMYLSAPNVAEDLSYALFGFGSMIRFSLRPGTFGAPDGKLAWRARTIDTPTKRLHDTRPSAFRPAAMGYDSDFGAPNMVNTAPLPWGDRLFATWDVGRPVELDPVTLDFLAEVGHQDSWGGSSFPTFGVQPFVMSTAHPVVDPDRDCLWTVKLIPCNFAPFQLQPWVVRYDGDGTTVQCWPVAGAAIEGTMHTISQTRDWLILADSGNFKADPGELGGGPRTVTIDDEVPVFLVRKEALEATAPGEAVSMHQFLVGPTTGHFYARYDDTDGIRVLFEHMDRVDLGLRVLPDDVDAFDRPIDPSQVGLYNFAMSPSSVSEVTFDVATGQAVQEVLANEDWSWNAQLSAMDWSTEGISDPTLHHIAYQGFRPHNITQRALALYGDRVDRSRFPGEESAGGVATYRRGDLEVTSRYEFPSLGDMPSSPTFVPRSAGADPGRSRYAGVDPGGHDGYVVCPVLSDDGFRVEVFDAADVGRGPVATAAAPDRACVPVLLHSAWAPRAVAAPDVERLRFADDVAGCVDAIADPDARAAVLTVAAAL